MKLAQRILRINIHGFVDGNKRGIRFLHCVLHLREI